MKFNNEDKESVQLVAEVLLAHNPLIKKFELTSTKDELCSRDIDVTLLNDSKLYIEVKDRRDYVKHTPRKHDDWGDLICDEYKKFRYIGEGILDKVILVNIFDDGFSIGLVKLGRPMSKTLYRYSQSLSYLANKSDNQYNPIIRKTLLSVPIYKFIPRDNIL